MKKWRSERSYHKGLFMGVCCTNRFIESATHPENISKAFKAVQGITPWVPATMHYYETFTIWFDEHVGMTFRKFPN